MFVRGGKGTIKYRQSIEITNKKVFKRKNSDKARCVTNAGPTRIGIIFAAKIPVEIAVVFPVENCSRDCSRTRNNHRTKQSQSKTIIEQKLL